MANSGTDLVDLTLAAAGGFAFGGFAGEMRCQSLERECEELKQEMKRMEQTLDETQRRERDFHLRMGKYKQELDKERALRVKVEEKLEATNRNLNEQRALVEELRQPLKRPADNSETNSPASKKPKQDDSMTKDQILYMVAEGIGARDNKWFGVGTWLGIPYNALMAISKNNPFQGVTMMANHMLQEWIRQTSDDCWHEKLIVALEKSGFHSLAQKLKDMQTDSS